MNTSLVQSLYLIAGFTALAIAARAGEPFEQLPQASPGKTWKIVWHDEFEGEKLDESKWIYRQEGKRKDGWWDRRTVSLDGQGHLVMKTLRDGDKYIDGCVATQGKFERAFGFYVARVQFQKEPGHWSAFWLTCNGIGKVGDQGRDGSEIDIMEKPWLDQRINHALHWDGYGESHKSETKVVKGANLTEGWHAFGLHWTPDEYVFFVDGRETWRSKAGGVCQVPTYILLSDEVGKWAGDIRKAKLPDQFLVDYVRVYELADSP